MKNKFTLSVIGTLLIGFSTISLANTCPTTIKQNKHGFWYSDEAPGWISHRATQHDVTISSSSFAGVVFSPTRYRIACVYKASSGAWVVLVSQINKGFKVDPAVKDDNNAGPAWKYSKQHDDYACGNPHVNSINKCSFSIENQ